MSRSVAAAQANRSSTRAPPTPEIDAFASAEAHYRADRLDRAAAECRALLETLPHHADAWSLLAVISFRQGFYSDALNGFHTLLKLRPTSILARVNIGQALRKLNRLEEALASFEAALAADPNHIEALVNRGHTLREWGRRNDALLGYDAALKIKPGLFEALKSQADTLRELGRPQEAIASYKEALAARPNHPETLCNLGVTLRALNRLPEALASYDEALRLKPDFVDALNNRSNLLRDLNRHEEALACLNRAHELNPAHAQVLANRGNVLQDLGRLDAALASYDKALHAKPDYPEALANRGVALQELQLSEAAVASYDRALALRPDYADALNNRGNALRDLDRLEEALGSFDSSLSLKPGNADALSNKGHVLHDLKRPQEAQASYDAALAIEPRHREAYFSRGAGALQLGDFASGWAGYEDRWNQKDASPPLLPPIFPEWNGGDIGGKDLLVFEEQGLGDIIQFSRFLPQFLARGTKVTFFVRRPLHRLLSHVARGLRLVDTLAPGESFDYQCALLSLPGKLETRLVDIPWRGPYIRAEPALVTRWRERIGREGLKIGIGWQGKPDGRVDRGRSFPLKHLRAISEIPGVRLISLQKSYGLDQLRDLPGSMRVETLGDAFDQGPDAFIDTAAVMSCVDLVISCDTSLAHLAGALGQPLMLALKHVPEWRWMLDRADCPWYPTARLYRQTIRNDWDGVFAQIARDLEILAARRASP